MTTDLVRTTLADGVYLSVLNDKKFKHNRLSVNLIVPLDEDTVSGYALLPFIMRKGSRECSDFTLLTDSVRLRERGSYTENYIE